MNNPITRIGLAGLLALAWLPRLALGQQKLLNVSYDVSREFYQEYNPAFSAFWKANGGEPVEISQSHGGSSKQALAVIDGLAADVVSFNQETDVAALAAKHLVDSTWSERFPHHSSPYTSTILFLVRKGNPKGIRDWNDLVRPGVQVILPNPNNGIFDQIAVKPSP